MSLRRLPGGVREGDLEVVRQLVSGGGEPWERFICEYRRVVLKAVHVAARRFGMGEADVEDATSEVFIELLKDDAKFLRAYRGESAFTTWLTVVAHRVAVREFARRIRSPRLDLLKPSGGSGCDSEILGEIEKLPDRQRRALILFHLKGVPYREIAQELDIPTNQVGMVLLRAREALGRMLKVSYES